MDLGELTLEKAKALQGTKFELSLGDGSTTMITLDEALPFDVRQRRRTRARYTPKRDPFALYFLGEPSLIVPQGSYTFRAETVTFEMLFIVPVGQDDQATEYEAVFA